MSSLATNSNEWMSVAALAADWEDLTEEDVTEAIADLFSKDLVAPDYEIDVPRIWHLTPPGHRLCADLLAGGRRGGADRIVLDWENKPRVIAMAAEKERKREWSRFVWDSENMPDIAPSGGRLRTSKHATG